MGKTVIHTGIHILLASVVMLSSSGFVIQRHFCQNELKEYSLFLKSSGCEHPTQEKPACPFHAEHNSPQEKPITDSKGCCENETEFVKLDQAYTLSSFDFSVVKSLPLVGPIPTFPQLNSPEIDIHPPHYLTYKPPPLVRNLPVSLQTFLL